jgi:hypothetical protein
MEGGGKGVSEGYGNESTPKPYSTISCGTRIRFCGFVSDQVEELPDLVRRPGTRLELPVRSSNCGRLQWTGSPWNH